MMKRVRMSLGPRSYEVWVGNGAIQKIGSGLKKFREKRAFLLSDEKLIDARTATVRALEKAGWKVEEIPLIAGESLKDAVNVQPIYGELLKRRANRNSVIFALGGGTVGDAAGFIAATYLRGIAWVGLPTTLLAQVDSSIGGKTGINHEIGKNLIGSFHQPSLVVCDTDFLKTLSRRELISGYGETLKYGLIFDRDFFSEMEKGNERFLSLDPRVSTSWIERAAKWKCKVVAQDEFDRKGVREALNFGHTFGHALESLTDYSMFQHGEAVIWGMRFALELSKVRKKISTRERDRAHRVLWSVQIPALPENFTMNQFFEKMQQDKKVRDGKIHFVLLSRIGKTVSDPKISAKDLEVAWKAVMLEKN